MLRQLSPSCQDCGGVALPGGVYCARCAYGYIRRNDTTEPNAGAAQHAPVKVESDERILQSNSKPRRQAKSEAEASMKQKAPAKAPMPMSEKSMQMPKKMTRQTMKKMGGR